MSYRQKVMLEAIGEITRRKCSSGKYPSYALSIEVAHLLGLGVHEVETECRRLADDGLVRRRKTINHESYELE